MFVHATHDSWLWGRLLEQGAAAVEYEADVAVLWACLAARIAERHDIALEMLRSADVKRALVHLAESDPGELPPPLGGGSGVAAGGELGSMPGLKEPRRGQQWWEMAGVAAMSQLTAAYAKVALHRLAQSARSAGVGGIAHVADDDSTSSLGGESSDEWAAEVSVEDHGLMDEPFVADYWEHEAPPLPVRPPLSLFAPQPHERLALSMLSVVCCAAGGLIWGAVAGAVASSRARRPIWRSALVTLGGAAGFEALMQAKQALLTRWRVKGLPDASAAVSAPPPYGTLRGLALTLSIDLSASCLLLHFLVQPNRAPFAFGGWVIGRAASLSQDVSIEYVEGFDEH